MKDFLLLAKRVDSQIEGIAPQSGALFLPSHAITVAVQKSALGAFPPRHRGRPPCHRGCPASSRSGRRRWQRRPCAILANSDRGRERSSGWVGVSRATAVAYASVPLCSFSLSLSLPLAVCENRVWPTTEPCRQTIQFISPLLWHPYVVWYDICMMLLREVY